jgi:putative endonuclease
MWNLLRYLRQPSNKFATQPQHLALGAYGERLAVEYLKQRGYRLVATNFVAPIGYSLRGRQIRGEIDIIAYDEVSPLCPLVLVEVKTRTSAELAAPQAAVDLRKQRQIMRTARLYRHLMRIADEPYRYDVISIIVHSNAAPEVTLLRGYFTEDRFTRSKWWRREI